MVFEDTALFERKGMIGLISGRPKRKLRRFVTKPVKFLLRPVSKRIKKRARKKLKQETAFIFKTEKQIFQEGLKEDVQQSKKKRK